MRLYIAEKFSVAKSIAQCLPGTMSGGGKQGYFDVSGVIVTYCVGHILEQVEAHIYDPKYKKWSLPDLPIIPSEWKLAPVGHTEDQFKVIQRLLRSATEVVHAGDPDREGQLLVQEVLDFCGYKGKVLRMLPNSNDPASIKRAISQIEDNARYNGLYEAGKARQRADWLIGINGTRAMTKALGDGRMISVGRVQTPVVWLVVRRDREIAAFASKDFFELEVEVKSASGTTLLLNYAPTDHAKRIWSKEQAEAIAKAIKGKAGRLSVVKERKKERPPLPYTLREFQQDGNKAHRWTAARSLDYLQALYLAGATTYPRTDIPYLKDEHAADVPFVLRAISSTTSLSGDVTKLEATPDAPVISKRVFDSKRVEEHHGIVPTRSVFRTPDKIPADIGMKAYEMVARRYLMALMPDFLFDETRINLPLEGLTFTAIGKSPVSLGWRVLASKPPEGNVLPDLADGEAVQVSSVKVQKRSTKAPEFYTEASLLADMSAIAKYVDDPALKARLKETSGIGTPATQAATIETLKAREYVYVDGKYIKSTNLGQSLVDHAPRLLVDPGVTALWEEALEQIQKGQFALAEFMKRIEGTTGKLVRDVVAMQHKSKITGTGAPVVAPSKKASSGRKKVAS